MVPIGVQEWPSVVAVMVGASEWLPRLPEGEALIEEIQALYTFTFQPLRIC